MKRIVADLDEWADLLGAELTKNVLRPVLPEIQKQKGTLETIDTKLAAMDEKVDKLFRFSGFKEFIFWVSALCSIGIAGYLIYTLVDWSVIFA